MRKPFVLGLVTQKIHLKQFEDGRIDLDIQRMREAAKKKKRNKLFTLVTGALLLSSLAYADYYLSDGSKVSWAGGNNVYVNGVLTTATRNADGRLVPTTGLTSSQRNQTNLLGSQYVGGNSQFNQNTGVSVPVFTNGQLTGYSNVFQNSSGLGRTFYTQNNGAGSTGQTVISGANGGSADFNWNRVDLTTGSTNGTSGQNTGTTGGTGGSTYVPPVNSFSTPPPPPPRYAIDSFEIYHNTAWDQSRIRNNRQMNQFYAGEALEVRVTGSNIRSAQVTFLFGNPNQDMPQMLIDSSDRRPTFQQTITLNGSLNGEGWLKHWAMIPDGNYMVRLTVTYNNGSSSTQEKQVQILGSVMDNMTPGGSDY